MHTFYRHKHTPRVAAPSWQPPLSRRKQKRRHHCFFCFLPSWSLGPFRVMQTSQNHKCLGALTLFGALRRTTSAFATSNVLGACREIVLTRVHVCIMYVLGARSGSRLVISSTPRTTFMLPPAFWIRNFQGSEVRLPWLFVSVKNGSSRPAREMNKQCQGR